MRGLSEKNYSETGDGEVMDRDVISQFEQRLGSKLEGKFTMRTEVDGKGVIFSWCVLQNASDIVKAAELVAEFGGRIMTISPLNNQEGVKINYHFYFEKVNCTICITLPDNEREVESITPILKSADWHEREMQEFYKIKLIHHPNSRPLFLDKTIQMEKDTMIPLSAAMNGTSTSTLWERVMKASSTGGEVK